jgi:hypothetical protein
MYLPVQETIFEAVALSSTLQILDVTETVSVKIRALAKHLLPSSSQHQSPPPPTSATNQMILKPLTIRPGCDHLIHLRLKYCNLNDMDMLVFSLGFADNRSLLTLSFENNLITNIGVMYFCQHWNDESPLLELVFGWNLIGTNNNLTIPSTNKARLQPSRSIHDSTCNTGITNDARENAWCALVDGLQRHPFLRSLNVSYNKMGTTGAMMLLQAAAIHPSLDSLALSLDANVRVEELLKFALEIPSTKLEKLHLDWTPSNILNESRPEIFEQVGQALLMAVQRNFYLTDLTCFELDPKWSVPIDFFLDLNQTCRPLLSCEEIMPSFAWPELLTLYDGNGKIGHIYYVLREQPWLVCAKSK